MVRLGGLVAATIALTAVGAAFAADAPTTSASVATKPANERDYAAAAREVTQNIQTAFYLGRTGLYAHSLTERHPDFMWGNGVMFPALLGAARHDPKTYLPIVARFFKAMDGYWDTRVKLPGYELRVLVPEGARATMSDEPTRAARISAHTNSR